MIRTKGEAGTGDVVEAVRHARAVLGEIRRLTSMAPEELMAYAKEIGAPYELLVARRPRTGPAAGGQLRRRRRRHPSRCRADDATGHGRRLRRLGHLQERRPGQTRARHRRGGHPLQRPEILAEVSRGLGEPMVGALPTTKDRSTRTSKPSSC
jgi:pyridoxal 5'-phosphate synthase pdxS subunit